MRQVRTILLTLLALALLFLGGYLLWKWNGFQEHQTATQADILLEQYKDVFKLITNEGYFQEIYSYKDYWGYDISPLRKQALIRAKGKVSLGYDLQAAEITMRKEDLTIILEKLPQPAILALEIEMDYYDLEAGTFNAFEPEDLNKIEKDIKNKMRQKALQSDLFRKAEIQKHTFYQTLRGMAQQAGWTIQYRDNLRIYDLP
ncbi:MAG: DUF4230 domain-containing protein [Saprospiraceae bacterium]|nr:DUF4230 domain-containing protein [Saprospiraceae bacterium]